MKKKLLAVILGVTMGISLMACGNTGGSASTEAPAADAPAAEAPAEDAAAPAEDTAAPAEDAEASAEDAAAAAAGAASAAVPEGSKIGFSTLTLAAEFFSVLDTDVHKYLEEAGYEVVTLSCEGNAATQVSDIENLISMGVDAILLFPADPSAVESVCAKAVEAGIKVLPFATSFQNRNAFSYIMGTDQYATGTNCAQMAAKWIDSTFPDAADGSIEVAVIGNTGSAESVARTDGMKTIEQETSKVKIVETFDLVGASDSNIKTQEFADIIRGKYPDVKAVLCYGVDAELGANEVFMRDNSLDRATFGIFGVDTSQVCYDLIKKSANNEALIRGTVSLGEDLAYNVFELVTGKLDYLIDDAGYINTPSTPVDISNVDEFIKQ